MRYWWLPLSFACNDPKSEHPDGAPADEIIVDGDDTHTSETDTSDSGNPSAVNICLTGTNPSALTEKNCVRQAGCQWDGSQYYGNYGHALDIGGDIDGDGLVDWVIGAPYEDQMVGDEVGRLDVGVAHIFRGGTRTEDPQPSTHLLGTVQAASLGYAVTIAPDLNGDGFDDVIAGGRGTHTDTLVGVGEVQILFGKAEGWDEPNQTADLVWLGQQEMARAGSTVAGLGDLNGDGLGELAIATNQRRISSSGYEQPGQGLVALFYGREDFSSYTDLTTASAEISGVGMSDGAGAAIEAGDLNGDGYRDLIIGAPQGDSTRGRIVILPGGPIPLTGGSSLDDAAIQLSGAEYSDNFGYAIASGDLNADGLDELVVSSPTSDENTPESGTVQIFMGQEDFFEAPPEAAHHFTGEWDDHQLGSKLIAGQDINGDGVGDLMMGAIGAWHGLITKGGRIYTMFGPSTDWPERDSAASSTLQFLGASPKDYLGNSMDSADINGDGKTDLMMSTSYANVDSNFDAGRVYLFWGE